MHRRQNRRTSLGSRKLFTLVASMMALLLIAAACGDDSSAYSSDDFPQSGEVTVQLTDMGMT